MPAPTITEAVYARYISALKERAGGGLARCFTGPAAQSTAIEGEARRRDPAGALRLEDLLVRPGFRPARAGRRPSTAGSSIWARSLRSGGADASSGPSFSIGSGRRTTRRRDSKTCCWPLFQGRGHPFPGRLAPGGRRGGRRRAARPGTQLGARLLRSLPARAAAGQPPPGPKGLLRRAHVRRIDKEGVFHTEWV